MEIMPRTVDKFREGEQKKSNNEIEDLVDEAMNTFESQPKIGC